jgi:hypothetical protein
MGERLPFAVIITLLNNNCYVGSVIAGIAVVGRSSRWSVRHPGRSSRTGFSRHAVGRNRRRAKGPLGFLRGRPAVLALHPIENRAGTHRVVGSIAPAWKQVFDGLLGPATSKGLF